MSAEQFAGLVRAILAALGGVLVALGFVNEEVVAEVAGAAAVIAAAVWSFVNKMKASDDV